MIGKRQIAAMTGALVLVAGASVVGLGAGPKGSLSPSQALPAYATSQLPRRDTPQTLSAPESVTGSVTITSNNPQGTASNAGTAISFRVKTAPASFHVYVRAGTANFTGCNTPPITAISVSCSAPTGVTCLAAAPLTTTGNGTAVASGTGNHNPASFTATFTLTDAWNYQVGTACSETLTWVYTEP